MDDQFSEVTRDFGLGHRHAYGRTVPRLTAHPTVLADRGPRLGPAGDRYAAPADEPVEPLFAAPGLVLVAALAIFEGYHWLHLIPSGSIRPTSVIFAVCVVPATAALTRHVDGQPAVSGGARVALVTAVAVLVLGLVVAFDRLPDLSRVLGATSLVLASSLVFLVVASERGRRPLTSPD